MTTAGPDPARCNKAIKLLEQFKRQAEKYGINLSPRILKTLKDLRDAGKIKSSDLPPKLRDQFPGEFAGMTLAAIRDTCGKSKKRG